MKKTVLAICTTLISIFLFTNTCNAIVTTIRTNPGFLEQKQNSTKNNNTKQKSKTNSRLINMFNNKQNTKPDIGDKSYRLTPYTPMSKAQCEEQKQRLGLKYCPHDNDHLAGAAFACGGIENLPSKSDLHTLAQNIYNNNTDATTIYGTRNDSALKKMGIFINDSHIYYWIGEESGDGIGGYVRMFASRGSIPYYAPRDGSGYVSHQVGKVNYGETKYIVTRNPKNNSNLVGLPNNDALVTICYK